jgi:DNA-binding LacI/PurR family transcriptional regulator
MALRDSSSISKQRRTEIKAIAKRIGYRPNVMARSLRGGSTNNIGLLWSLGGTHDSLGVIRDISIRLMHKGYACNMADSLSDQNIIRQCLADFCSRNIDGVIVRLNKVLAGNKEICSLLQKMPNVVIVVPDPEGSEFEALAGEFDVLVHGTTYAIRETVDYFAKSGRKRIALLNVKNEAHEYAFAEQLRLHGLVYSDDSVINVERCVDIFQLVPSQIRNIGPAFLSALRSKFDKKMPFDALIVSCDEGAVTVMNYLERIGYKIPEDIAIVGSNNNILAPCFKPPLASIDRCGQELAESVVNMLFSRIKNPALPPRHELIKMKFVHRESAG